MKQTDVYGNYSSSTSKSGLLNSAKLTAAQITKYLGVPTQVEVCVDGNEVDKFVHQFNPTVCIIEAIWVTPAKFTELVKLHPTVQFVVLIHSSIAFLSNEGNAILNIRLYEGMKNVTVAFNSLTTSYQFTELRIGNTYLPNIFSDVSIMAMAKPEYVSGNIINVGCFGAIRPFKNMLIQAMAAIVLAKKLNAPLNFHINSTRPEQGGEPTLKNIRSLFIGYDNYNLIEHDWEDRDIFLTLIRSMDIGMQVSFSETFNVIAADFVLENVPIVVSDQIDWMPLDQQVSIYDIDSMVTAMIHDLGHTHRVVKKNVKSLTKYNTSALGVWNSYLKTI